MLLSIAGAFWQVVFLFALPMGVAYFWAIIAPGAPVLNSWFHRKKGLVLALMSVGGGIGGLLLPFTHYLITELGWRSAVAICGGIVFTFGLIVLLAMRNSPEEMGLMPDGDPVPQQSAAGAGGATLKQALRSWLLWTNALGCACMLFINISLVFHMVALVHSRGESEHFGATLLSLLLFTSVPVVLLSGWLADRAEPTKVLVGMSAMTTLGVLVLAEAGSLFVYAVAMMLLSFATSTLPVLWTMVGHKFGRRHFNSIRMTMLSVITVGSAVGPLLAGMTYDSTGSYDDWLEILPVVGVLGFVAFLVATGVAGAPLSDTQAETSG